MENIKLVKKNEEKEIWLQFFGDKGNAASICLNNLANDRRDSIAKNAMLQAIRKELST